MGKYNTNLAAEFFVLSCLHRLGVTAALTLGNKKAVDILVARDTGDSITVEVKGVAKRHDWRVGNIRPKNPARHFIILVCFEGAISDTSMPAPKVWVVPSSKLAPFIRPYKGQTNVSTAAIFKEGAVYENAWHLIR